MKNIINLIVGEDGNNKRVDIILAKHDKSLSRTRVKNLILNKKLKINKNIISDPSKKVSTNDYINLEIPKPKKASLKPFNFKLEISAVKKSGKFLGKALIVNFLLFLERFPPWSFTPGAVPTTLTGMIILISFPSCNWKKSI